MAVMNTSIFLSNPRRWMHMLWVAAGIMFFIAVFHSTQIGSASKDWVTTKVQKIGQPAGRVSMKEYMRVAEASWAKTVKQRHDLILKDWGTVDKLPM